MGVRHFLTVTDLNGAEFHEVLSQAAALKRDPAGDALAGRTVALIFGKPSTRTRVSFSVGVYQLGGMPLYLSEQELQMRNRPLVKAAFEVFPQAELVEEEAGGGDRNWGRRA